MCGMMRMKLVALLALAMVAGAARAATETVNGVTYTYTVSDSAAWISTVSMSKSGGVTVPSQLGGFPVKSIGTAFYENEMIRTVKLPNGITSLSSQAFMKCINLTSITLPDGLESLGYKSFYRCEKLVSIKLPPSVKNMGDRCFAGCKSLTSVNIPDGITYLPTGLFCGCSSLASISIPSSVTSIGEIAFGGNWQWWDDNVYHDSLRSLTSVEFHEGLVSIGKNAFCYCSQVKSFNIPCTVTTLGDFAFNGCYEAVMTFNAAPPSGATNSSILNTKSILYPKGFGSAWAAIVGIDHFGGYAENKQAVQIVSSSIRKNNPTVLDVVYKVTSTKPTVKVRALAFEDGVRSFAKVTRPETFVADVNGVATAGNVGDAVAANVEHTLSWQVSSDFKTDLAKMKFEVLAVEDDILPLEFIIIPANGSNKAMELSWDLMTESEVFDALLWLYAAKTDGLTLTNGVLKNGTTQVGSGTSIMTGNAISYVFSKMGYNVLSGANLTYANDMTRMGLSPSGVRQYAYKWID